MTEKTLNENEKKRIEEEEKLRVEAREKAEKELKNKKQTQGCLGCLGVIILLLIAAVAGSIFSNDKEKQSAEVAPTSQEQQGQVEEPEKETEEERKKREEEEAAKREAEEEEKRKAAESAEKNLQGYIDLINATGMNVYVDSVGYYSGFKWIEVTVKNTWHYEPKQIRLQAAQTLWEVWATQFCPEEETLDNCRIRLVDLAGNEVGGSSAWGGSVVNVKD